jgi:hypothetical protein
MTPGTGVSTRALGAWLVAAALAVLAAAFVGVCVQASTLWPWTSVVHESGDRTLLQTIGYVEHASRELPLDILLGLAIGGAAVATWRRRDPVGGARGWLLLGGAAVVAAGILASTWALVGSRGLYENLMQMPTRPGEPLVAGEHWRYHLLSSLACMLLGAALARAVSASTPREWDGGRMPEILAWTMFGGATVLWGISAASFFNGVYLGHQARELATHAIVSVPLGLGLCLRLAVSQPVDVRGITRTGRGRLALLLAAIAAGIGAWLAWGVISTDAVSQGQTSSLPALIFPHFFEHTLTYVIVALVAPGVYLATGRDR